MNAVALARGWLRPGLVVVAAMSAALGCSSSAVGPGTQSIGPEGGSVSLTESGATVAQVVVPAGALDRTVTISAQAGTYRNDLPTGARRVGPVVVFGPEGQTFAQPVTITIRTTSPAQAMYTRPVGGAVWTMVPGASYDAVRGVIVASVAHFSEFVPASPPCMTDADCAMGEVCVSGTCAPVPMDAGVGCAPGTADCDGNRANGCEANVLSDPHSCGACGVSCAAGQSCAMGACVPGSSCTPHMEVCNGIDDDCDGLVDDGLMCPPPPTDAGVTCMPGTGDCDGDRANGCEVYLESDPSNCGACGVLCPGGGMCVHGVCTGHAMCAADSDCAMGEVCVSGTCAPVPMDAGVGCAPGTADCDGNRANGCEANVLSDPHSCGACGVSCAAGQSCAMGACVLGGACTPHMEVCNGIDDDCDGLVDDGLGSTSCGVGACRRTVSNCVMGTVQVCTPGAPSIEVCNGVDDDCNGMVDEGLMCPPPPTDAGVSCVPGMGDCDGLGANGCETNLASDPHNCGACGVSCAAGRMCAAGVCR